MRLIWVKMGLIWDYGINMGLIWDYGVNMG